MCSKKSSFSLWEIRMQLCACIKCSPLCAFQLPGWLLKVPRCIGGVTNSDFSQKRWQARGSWLFTAPLFLSAFTARLHKRRQEPEQISASTMAKFTRHIPAARTVCCSSTGWQPHIGSKTSEPLWERMNKVTNRPYVVSVSSAANCFIDIGNNRIGKIFWFLLWYDISAVLITWKWRRRCSPVLWGPTIHLNKRGSVVTFISQSWHHHRVKQEPGRPSEKSLTSRTSGRILPPNVICANASQGWAVSWEIVQKIKVTATLCTSLDCEYLRECLEGFSGNPRLIRKM